MLLQATRCCFGKGLIPTTTNFSSTPHKVTQVQPRRSLSSRSSCCVSSGLISNNNSGRLVATRYHSISTVSSSPSSTGTLFLRSSALANSSSSSSFTQLRFYSSDAEDVIVKVPNMGDSISSGTINTWLKKVGDSVLEDDIVCQIDTDKVTADVRSPVGGVMTETIGNPQDNVNVGDVLFKVKKGAVATTATATPKAEPAKPTPTAAAAAAAAASLKVEPVKPTPTPAAAAASPKVEQAKPTPPPEPAASKPTPQPATPKPVVEVALPVAPPGTRSERRVPMSRMRLRIAERLKDSQNTSAMLTTFNEVDMSKLMDLRNKFKDDFEKKHSAKLGFMSAFVKASAMALKEQPNVNAVIDGKDVVYRDFIDISVAVATPTGLVVPVIRDCQDRSFASIEKTIADFGERARVGKLAIEEMQGGTFTISNGGVFGSLYGTPIINPPQSAILGMHTVKWRPICDPENNNAIVARPMMYLALTYDHRLIDGKDAVTFLVRIKNMIEDPRRFLLEL